MSELAGIDEASSDVERQIRDKVASYREALDSQLALSDRALIDSQLDFSFHLAQIIEERMVAEADPALDVVSLSATRFAKNLNASARVRAISQITTRGFVLSSLDIGPGCSADALREKAEAIRVMLVHESKLSDRPFFELARARYQLLASLAIPR